MPPTYEPYGDWPEHPNKEWERTQDAAKARGWTISTHSNHSTRWLHCPMGECKLGPIYSTAKGTEDVARDFYNDVLACPHGEADQRHHVEQATEHMETGERFARAARRRLEASAARGAVQELWDIADHSATEAGAALKARDDDIINRIEVGEWTADHLDQEADEVLAETPLAGTTDPRPVAEAATLAMHEAQDVLEEDIAKKHAERPALETRLQNLREDLNDIRLQMDGPSTDT